MTLFYKKLEENSYSVCLQVTSLVKYSMLKYKRLFVIKNIIMLQAQLKCKCILCFDEDKWYTNAARPFRSKLNLGVWLFDIFERLVKYVRVTLWLQCLQKWYLPLLWSLRATQGSGGQICLDYEIYLKSDLTSDCG